MPKCEMGKTLRAAATHQLTAGCTPAKYKLASRAPRRAASCCRVQDAGQVLLLHQQDYRSISETAAQLPCAGCTPWGWCRRPPCWTRSALTAT